MKCRSDGRLPGMGDSTSSAHNAYVGSQNKVRATAELRHAVARRR